MSDNTCSSDRILTQLRIREFDYSNGAQVLVDVWLDELLLTSYLVFSGPAWKARELYYGHLRFTKDSELVPFDVKR